MWTITKTVSATTEQPEKLLKTVMEEILLIKIRMVSATTGKHQIMLKPLRAGILSIRIMTEFVTTSKIAIPETAMQKGIAMVMENATGMDVSTGMVGETEINKHHKYTKSIQLNKINYIKLIKNIMKIAVPVTTNNQIDDHFGHCENYKVYTIEDNGEIKDSQIIPSPQGCGCKSNIAGVLASQGVSIMLAGGIGEGAINVLKRSGIDVLRGCEGNADMVVKLYVAGKITDSGSNCQQHQNHHGEGNDHVCNH